MGQTPLPIAPDAPGRASPGHRPRSGSDWRGAAGGHRREGRAPDRTRRPERERSPGKHDGRPNACRAARMIKFPEATGKLPPLLLKFFQVKDRLFRLL